MPSTLRLLPMPRVITPRPGIYALPADLYIVLESHPQTRAVFPAERFAIEAETFCQSRIHISVGQSVEPAHEIRVNFDDSLAPEVPEEIRKQAYALSITPGGIRISALTAAATFYAFQTLVQIFRETAFAQLSSAKGKRNSRKLDIEDVISISLPCLEILDYPDYARRGVYHDAARGKVPTVDTILQLIDDLGHLKFNEFQLYIENNFQFRKFPEMYDDTNPFTAEEMLILDEACRARHIDFVPSLTSLGHFEKILSRPRFRHLAEAEPAQLKAINATCWHEAAPWSLCVTDPEARQFLKEMYDEFLPNFSSPQFNICCDEAYDLCVIRSKEAADKAGGPGALYIEWIGYCNALSKTHGKSIQMWGDIILHHPDLIAQLPEGATLLEWGYEHDHKFEEHCELFAERLGIKGRAEAQRHKGTKALREEDALSALVPQCLSALPSFYVAPGTSSWLTLSARTKNAMGNIHRAAAAGLKYGAHGLLVTDWGDNGHQQFLAVSLLPFAYAAAASWNLKATPNPYEVDAEGLNSQFLVPASLHLFQDAKGQFASWVYDLGLTYERFSWQRFNASIDWFLFREKWDFPNYVNRAQPGELPKIIAACKKAIVHFQSTYLRHPDAWQLVAELIFTAEEIIHTCRRTALRQSWLAAERHAGRLPIDPELPPPFAPKRLPKSFKKEMSLLRADAVKLKSRFEKLWLERNKPSRLRDVLAEFDRLVAEYKKFGRV